MNGTEQRARHTALEAVTQRQDDLELVVETLGKDIVVERQLRIDAVAGTRACCDRRHRYQLQRDQDDEAALAAFGAMSLWQRLRWIVRGRRPLLPLTDKEPC